MSSIIGPAIAILFIFAVYYAAQRLDSSGEVRKTRAELEKIVAETKREEISVRKRELELEMGKLAIEAKKLDQIEHDTRDATEADFRVVEDLEDKTEKKR